MAAAGGGVALALLIAAPALAGTISTPSSNPFTIPVDGSGNPVAFDVAGTGFPANTPIYVEECDGVAPTSPGWSPTTHCDNQTSGTPITSDGSGNVTFPASNQNSNFIPFPAGLSPSGLFNCIAPGQTPPSNGKPSYTNCQLRMSSNDSGVTADQAFITLTYPAATGQVAEVPYAVILPIGFLLIGGAFWFFYRRRSAAAAAA
jgi:hypothetical protein